MTALADYLAESGHKWMYYDRDWSGNARSRRCDRCGLTEAKVLDSGREDRHYVWQRVYGPDRVCGNGQ